MTGLRDALLAELARLADADPERAAVWRGLREEVERHGEFRQWRHGVLRYWCEACLPDDLGSVEPGVACPVVSRVAGWLGLGDTPDGLGVATRESADRSFPVAADTQTGDSGQGTPAGHGDSEGFSTPNGPAAVAVSRPSGGAATPHAEGEPCSECGGTGRDEEHRRQKAVFIRDVDHLSCSIHGDHGWDWKHGDCGTCGGTGKVPPAAPPQAPESCPACGGTGWADLDRASQRVCRACGHAQLAAAAPQAPERSEDEGARRLCAWTTCLNHAADDRGYCTEHLRRFGAPPAPPSVGGGEAGTEHQCVPGDNRECIYCGTPVPHQVTVRADRREKRTTFYAVCNTCGWQGKQRTKSGTASADGVGHVFDAEGVAR